MNINRLDYKTVWRAGSIVCLIDQNQLPFSFEIYKCRSCVEICEAIKKMVVRGAGAIGAAAGYAMAQAFMEARSCSETFWDYVNNAKRQIEDTRPTARNLFYATNRVYASVDGVTNFSDVVDCALSEAEKIADEDIDACLRIGRFGSSLINDGNTVLTHCNAGALAFVDYGSALSPIYLAYKDGKYVRVLVSETRPRGQGAKLTAWELNNAGIDNLIIPDSAGAFFISTREVNLVIVGADRIARNGDVANKIGTLEKAIVAKEYGIPFYVAAPMSTVDFDCEDGDSIPIEERGEDEVLYQTGLDLEGVIRRVLVCSPGSKARNPAFDITPARYITGIITDRGIIEASEGGIAGVS